MYQAARLPEAKLRPIFDDAPVDASSRQLDQVEGHGAVPQETGFLPDEPDRGRPSRPQCARPSRPRPDQELPADDRAGAIEAVRTVIRARDLAHDRARATARELRSPTPRSGRRAIATAV